MLVRNGFCHERHSKDDDTGDDKQNDGEVEVVDSTYDGGAFTGANTAARPECKLGDHPGQADSQSDHESTERTLRKYERRKMFQIRQESTVSSSVRLHI